MVNWFFRHHPFNRPSQKGCSHAWTLVELLLILSIVGTLAAIAVPVYTGYMDKQRVTLGIVDISNIESQIERFRALSGRPPNTFAEAGIAAPNDPWGRSYVYLRIEGLDKKDWDGKCRRDKFLKPLNSDYDLYSVGKDGASHPNVNNKQSYDDVIRCSGGAYVGPVSEY